MDSIRDTLIRLKNGQKAHRKSVILSHDINKQVNILLNVLQRLGIIINYRQIINPRRRKPSLEVQLNYSVTGVPVFTELNIISTPKRRVYSSVKSLWKLNQGAGTFLLFTPKGLLTDQEARALNVGGEILCSIR